MKNASNFVALALLVGLTSAIASTAMAADTALGWRIKTPVSRKKSGTAT